MAKVASRLCRRYLVSNGDDFTTTLSSASTVTGPEATLPIFIVGGRWGAWVSSHTGEVVKRTDRLTEREWGEALDTVEGEGEIQAGIRALIFDESKTKLRFESYGCVYPRVSFCCNHSHCVGSGIRHRCSASPADEMFSFLCFPFLLHFHFCLGYW